MRAAKVAILTVCLLAGAGAFPAHAAGLNRSEAEGRRHARKANQLADLNKCKAAIPEYTKAIRLLKDPTLLFNRAECYRRTGEATKAVADYRKFLVQLPSAPNRAQVQSQIATLGKKPAPAVVAVAVPKPSLARAPAPKPAVVPSAPAPKPTPAPVAEDRPPVEPLVPEREPEPPVAIRAPPPAPAPAEAPGPMALVDRKASPVPAVDSSSESSHWWIWVVGAVVLAGAGAGTYFALKQGATDIPPSALGNYKF
jgi:tetratricopeptide (TPR) repeat protein